MKVMNFNNHDKCDHDKQEILKTFESTILKVLESVEKTQNKFVEMVAKIETEHFKQLEKQSAKHLELLKDQLDTLVKIPTTTTNTIQPLSSIDESSKNEIEQEETEEYPLSDVPHIPMTDGMKIQLEGEEEIYPVNIS